MKKRLFLALSVSDELRDVLQEYVKTYHFQHIRWVKPENLHTTLFFIGDLEEAFHPSIIEKLEVALVDVRPFLLIFDKITFVPSIGSPRLLWAQFHQTEEYTRLVKLVKETLHEYIDNRFYKETKELIPHATFARFKKRISVRGIKLKQPTVSPLHVTQCQLVTSCLTTEGPEYSILASFKFSK